MVLKFRFIVACCIFLVACQYRSDFPNQTQTISRTSVEIPHEKYQLANGLTVILHQDTSDPLVHVDVTYHVGSAREELGKTGFAHFFEHMMFQGSQHVADEEHFKTITNAGGSLNGTTNRDRTNYFQTVPANQLEKVLWLESDRMGYLLPAVTNEKFEIQRETVKNERAERIENQPYGQRGERIAEALYPSGHPYSWLTIGYVEDLDRVNVGDLRAFFSRWYGPNNAVLTIGGDIDIEQTKAWVNKYFGEIPAGPQVNAAKKVPVTLANDRYITLEDNVHLPLLQLTLPTVSAGHDDEAALDVLADILGGGKTSILYKNLVKNGKAVQASASHPCSELACEFTLLALASPDSDVSLKDLEIALRDSLTEFEERGVVLDDLLRVKAQIEAGTLFGLESVQGKVSTLAYNETFYGEPDRVEKDIQRYNSVTKQDVMDVFRRYIKDHPAVVLSVVPLGATELAAAEQNTPRPTRQISSTTTQYDTSPVIESSFDRLVKPKAGPAPIVSVPEIWRDELSNGIRVIGSQNHESPTVSLILSIEGGMLLDPVGQYGLASLTNMMMNESTQHYSNEAMSNELSKMGSAITFSDGGRYIQVYVSTLRKNLNKTMALLAEKLYRPAFKPEDFARLKNQLINGIQSRAKDAGSLAGRARDIVLFGEDNRMSYPVEGTLQSVSAISLDDVKAFYQRYFSPAKASVVIVGDITQANAIEAIDFLNQWEGEDYHLAPYKPFPTYQQQGIYLVDKPGAVQSVVKIVKRALPYDATGLYFKAQLMNFPLGGDFNSRINLNLREDKSITYGAFSSFQGGKTLGWFEASSDVLIEKTALAINEFFHEIETYQEQGITQQELEFMRNAFTLSEALEYETPSSKAGFLRHLLSYNLPTDYKKTQLALINSISKQEIDAVAAQLLDTSQMQIIVVADKETVLPLLETFDLPIYELDIIP